MPKEIILCDREDTERCKNSQLEFIAQTKDKSYRDNYIREDRADYIAFPVQHWKGSTCFYFCGNCQTIYFVDVNDGVLKASELNHYEGRLTREDIRQFIPEFKGYFDEEVEQAMLLRLHPEDYEEEHEVEERQGVALVEVPKSLVGRTVIVRGKRN